MSNDNRLLDVKTISKSYSGGGDVPSVHVFEKISFSVSQGETIAVVGPSGSGKSTLLNLIGTLDKVDDGDISLNGITYKNMNEKELAEFRNKTIGFIFQMHHLLPQCSVLENVLIPTIPRKDLISEGMEERALNLLKRVGLENRLNHKPGQLSGGERQRTAVVRALINKPVLLLADEPTGSLDHGAALDLIKLLLELNQEEGTSLMIVTHAEELASKMDRIFRLQDGKIL